VYAAIREAEMNKPWSWVGLAVVAGCGDTELSQDDLDALAASLESDVEELARTADAFSAELRDAPQLDVSGETSGVGDCVWAWTLTGPNTAAVYSASLASAPCGGGWDGERLTLEYAVTAGQVDGTVAKGTDTWAYELTGTRSSEFSYSTVRTGERTYTADWSLDALTGETDGFDPGPFELAATYTGFAGGVWDIAVSRAADLTVTGTVVGPNGASCTITGTSADDATVTCASGAGGTAR
jgi:hypothetical protein